MNIKVYHISEFFENWAPFSTQAEYDNSGLLIGSPNTTVRGILTCLDVTSEVIDEAISTNCNLIVAHHPIIFRRISKINPDTSQGSLIYNLIRNEINVLAVHTNLDAAQNGVSFVLADKLQLQDVQILSFHDEAESRGYGCIGNLNTSMSQSQFLDFVCTQLGTESVRFAGSNDSIRKVAVCGGTGISLASDANKSGADAFVTADIKYHEYFDFPNLLKVDAGHYETEVHIASHLHQLLSNQFKNLLVRTSQVITNPMRIHISNPLLNQKR
jgi:dinuclear metal center YbgI/SA1388 family protein